MRGGCDGHEDGRKGAERRRYAGKGRDTADGRGGCGDGGHENPKRRAQGQRRGREEMERQRTGAEAGAEGAPGQRDAGRFVGTASSVGQNETPHGMQESNG